MARGEKISTDGGGGLSQNPFAALSGKGLPTGNGAGVADPGRIAGKNALGGGFTGQPGSASPATSGREKVLEASKNRGRVDIKRETGGRGGKTVTVVSGFVGIGLPEKEQLAKKMRAACGCGGTVKDGQIEIQGDQRETVARILSEAGFRPVFAGG